MNDLLSPITELHLNPADGSVARAGFPALARIDMHCHTSFSVERIKYLPFTYFPLLEPEQVYDLAKSRGMDFVTLTDHDTLDGCNALRERRGDPADFLAGEEVSVVFPDDGTIIHVNVYDIDDAQHRELQRARRNIFDFVECCRRIDKLYVLNHMTWNARHRALTRRQIEIMLEHFPVFEGINGTRSYAHNAFAWHATRESRKILVAGSDSHTNRVGTTYTVTEGATRAELLAAIRAGRTAVAGAFGTPEKLSDDVWLIIQKNFERRMVAATSMWERGFCRAARACGRFVCPLACLGYHKRQNSLIRDFVRALPGGVDSAFAPAF